MDGDQNAVGQAAKVVLIRHTDIEQDYIRTLQNLTLQFLCRDLS